MLQGSSQDPQDLSANSKANRIEPAQTREEEAGAATKNHFETKNSYKKVGRINQQIRSARHIEENTI